MALEGTQASTTGRWHLIAQKGDLTALVYPGMRLGEDAAGCFTLSPEDPLIELGVEHDLLTVRVLTALDGRDGKLPPPLYVNADTRVRVNLPHDQFIIDPAWATGQHCPDVIDIQVQPRAPRATGASNPIPLETPVTADTSANPGPPPPRWMNEREYGVLVAIGMLVMIFLLISWNQPVSEAPQELQVAALEVAEGDEPVSDAAASIPPVATNEVIDTAGAQAGEVVGEEVQEAGVAPEPADDAVDDLADAAPVLFEPFVATIDTEPQRQSREEVIEEPALALNLQTLPPLDTNEAEASQNVAVVSSLVPTSLQEPPATDVAQSGVPAGAGATETVSLENTAALPTELPIDNDTFGSEVADVVPLLDALPLTADTAPNTPAAVADFDEAGLLNSAEAVETAVITDEAPLEAATATTNLFDREVGVPDGNALRAANDVAAVGSIFPGATLPSEALTEPVGQPLLAVLTEPAPLIPDESDLSGPVDDAQADATLDAAPVIEATPEETLEELPEETVEDSLYPYGDLTVVRQRAPVYPRRAPDGASGYVDVEFTVNEQGRVELVEVRGNPPDYFARAAISAVRRWRFEAVRVDGRPVAVRTMLRLTFQG